MRWTGTQAHTQVSTHVKWAGVQCGQEQGARDNRTGRETYYFVTYYLLTSLPSIHPSLRTSLLPYLLLITPPLLATLTCKLLAHLALATYFSPRATTYRWPLTTLALLLPILPLAHLALAQGARLVGELGRARPQALQRLLRRGITLLCSHIGVCYHGVVWGCYPGVAWGLLPWGRRERGVGWRERGAAHELRSVQPAEAARPPSVRTISRG